MFQDEILAIFRSLRGHGRVMHPLSKPSVLFPSGSKEYTLILMNRFAIAEDWQQVAQATRRSTLDSEVDEMIQIIHSRRAAGKATIPNVRRVEFDRPADIHRLVALKMTTSPSVEPASQLFAPPSESYQDFGQLLDDATQNDVDAHDDAQEDGEEHQEEIMEKELKVIKATPEERAAVDVISQMYISWRRRRNAPAKGRLRAILSQTFLDCLAKSEGIRNRQYRYMVRGPLPHALLCLEVANTDVYGFKRTMAKQMKSLKADELTEADLKLTQTT